MRVMQIRAKLSCYPFKPEGCSTILKQPAAWFAKLALSPGEFFYFPGSGPISRITRNLFPASSSARSLSKLTVFGPVG